MKVKKVFSVLALALAVSLCIGAFAACGGGGFNKDGNVIVVQREDGSGTRGAFEELLEIEGKVAADSTQSSTGAVLTFIKGDPQSVGYISAGSVNDSVKALKIDGVAPTADNIAGDSYKIARPFLFVTKKSFSEHSAAAQDFYKFAMSTDGQKLAREQAHLVSAKESDDVSSSFGKAYSTPPGTVTGEVKLNGSTSMKEVVEVWIDAYKALQPSVTISYTGTGSGAGITAAGDGTADFGLASRSLKDSEKATLTGLRVAIDGIAVIVHKDNALEDVKLDELKKMFTTKGGKWSDYIK